MPVVVVDWENVDRHWVYWIAQHRLRYRIFVERLGWNVPAHHGLEYDRFDTPAAKYLVWIDDRGEARGVTRLLPTTSEYMIKSLWPDWLENRLPRSPAIWEATRFGCDHALPRHRRQRVVLDLIAACQRFGIANGVSAYLAVMPIWIFQRVLIPAGCRLTMLGPRRRMEGSVLGVAQVDVSAAILAKVEAHAAAMAPDRDEADIVPNLLAGENGGAVLAPTPRHPHLCKLIVGGMPDAA